MMAAGMANVESIAASDQNVRTDHYYLFHTTCGLPTAALPYLATWSPKGMITAFLIETAVSKVPTAPQPSYINPGCARRDSLA